VSQASMPDGRFAPEAGTDRPTVTIATYPDYLSAQRAVDFLSDNDFPVAQTAIVGTDLRLVEQVPGRLTIWGAVFGAVAHAMTGGRRDFTSRSSLAAGQYAITVDAEVADQARQLLTRMHRQQASVA
jgi:hypothetical protein